MAGTIESINNIGMFNKGINEMNDLMIKTYVLGSVGLQKMRGFCKDQNGVTAVEYAIVLAGVAAVVAVVFGDKGQVQSMINSLFTKATAVVSTNIK